MAGLAVIPSPLSLSVWLAGALYLVLAAGRVGAA